MELVDKSVLQTAEAFIRFRPGFHGDTGIRDYLYHRLMTNLPNAGTYTRANGEGTLMAQAEWYTTLKYRRTGQGASRGRFDLGIPDPSELDLPTPRPLVAIECGRNKKADDLVRDIEASAEHEGPEPADISKLTREILHVGLPYGYALEFYDEDLWQANELVRRLELLQLEMHSDRLRVIVLVCTGGSRPLLTFAPSGWGSTIAQCFGSEVERIESLTCARHRAGVPRISREEPAHTNRVTRESFYSSCSSDTRALIDDLERTLGSKVKLVFGGNTMTVNRKPTGKLLRIERHSNVICELDPIIGGALAQRFGLSLVPREYRIDASCAFREAVVTAVRDGIVR